MRRLEEIEARAKAATPGPWSVVGEGDLPAINDLVIVADLVRDEDGDEMFICNTDWTDDARNPPDARFISHAREDVPWLCEKLREAVRLLGELPASHLPELNHRRDALLAALDEVTR